MECLSKDGLQWSTKKLHYRFVSSGGSNPGLGEDLVAAVVVIQALGTVGTGENSEKIEKWNPVRRPRDTGNGLNSSKTGPNRVGIEDRTSGSRTGKFGTL